MSPHHTLYYRATPDAQVQIIRISGDKDPGAVCNEVRNRLFALADDEKIEQALHADRIHAKVYK